MRTIKHRHFLDSSIVLQLMSADAAKADQAEQLLVAGPVISVQVLNEVTQVCRQKLNMGWDEIEHLVALLRSFCKIVPVTEAIYHRARAIAEQHDMPFYDASLIAAAVISGCQVLYSEVIRTGPLLQDKLSLENPFR